jgi:hypothetical protein
MLRAGFSIRKRRSERRGGEVEWWRGGEVERWRGGVVERWRGGVVERWRGGVVEWWSGGVVECGCWRRSAAYGLETDVLWRWFLSPEARDGTVEGSNPDGWCNL